MARARFSIGIDLGTTNSALAFAPLEGEAAPEILLVPQWESPTSLTDASTLPSFLYLPDDTVAAQLWGKRGGEGEWVIGRLARSKAGETPGRVVHAAKSWLCHHTADRSAAILPWGSQDLTREQKISPVRASALILSYLRGVWNDRFAATGLAFDDQQIMIAVPASFDAAAQRLTVAAAEEAGFPDGVRLVEEPQAAFYCWLSQRDPERELWQQPSDRDGAPRHVLVIDIGGGTSDFSLFELRRDERSPIPLIKRIAVSDHILLGGDNIDLAIAHFVEARFGVEHGQLSGRQWNHLVAFSRDLKEKVLSESGSPDEQFALALPGRGSSLIAGSRTAIVTRAETESVLLDGFFPLCPAGARPYRTSTALREFGLPYASDSAVTRHLADFLRDRPRVDAVLFNGGSLQPPVLRQRLRDQIAAWQDGFAPLILENAEPSLAVARGAARFGALLQRQASRIEAGAAHAVFLEVQRPPTKDGELVQPLLVCVLPRGATPEEPFEIADPPLELRTNRLVSFRAYSSSRHGRSRAGDILAWSETDFRPLPPLQTIVKLTEPSSRGADRTVPVRLAARMNALGLLQVSCVSADPAIQQSWPLEFNLRPHEQAGTGAPHLSAVPERSAQMGPNVPDAALEAARKHIATVFTRTSDAGDRPADSPRHGRPRSRHPRLSSGRQEKTRTAAPSPAVAPGEVMKNLERILGRPRNEWNATLLRMLWPALEAHSDARRLSTDHEETWLVITGFLLRPGFGVPGDDLRMDSLWGMYETRACFPGRRIKFQEYILWRRVAGGLSRERQEKLLVGELDKLRSGKAPPELVRLAGSLERISQEMKTELANAFIEEAAALARTGQPCAPYLTALGLLLNRAPLYAGPETVVSPDLVGRAYAGFRSLDWTTPDLLELQTLFLRAARVVDDRGLDVPKPLRNQIAGKLESSGVAPLRTARIRGFVPVGISDRAALYGESLPPGLVLAEGWDGG